MVKIVLAQGSLKVTIPGVLCSLLVKTSRLVGNCGNDPLTTKGFQSFVPHVSILDGLHVFGAKSDWDTIHSLLF
jgi:hypothetical protein